MNPFTGQCIEVKRKCGHQRLALAGAHLCDFSLVEDHTTDELNVIVAQSYGAAPCLAHCCKGLRKQVVQRFTCCQSLPEFVRLGAQRLIGERTKLGFERIDLFNRLLKLRNKAIITIAEHLLEKA